MTGWTIRRRLLRNVLAAVAAGWLVAVLVGTYALNHEMTEILDRSMESDAALIQHLLASKEGSTINQWIEAHPETDTQLVRVYSPDRPAPPAPWPVLTSDGIHRSDNWVVLRRSSDVGVVEVGQSLAWRYKELMEAARAFLFLIVPLLGLVTWAVIAALRSGLRGLSGFARQVDERTPNDLSPLSEQDMPQELRLLADGMNRYLARIRDLRAAERTFIASAAHELRTPLAVIRSRLQLMAEDAPRAPHPAEVMAAVDRLSHRVERLLQMERAEAGVGLARQPVDLTTLIRLICADQHATDRRIVFDDADQEHCEVQSDPDGLAIILRNLLDNALEHGTGPVLIRLRPGPEVVIRNAIEGPADIRLGRFSKGATSCGEGLGLSIVTRLCDDLGIDVQICPAGAQIEAVLRFH